MKARTNTAVWFIGVVLACIARTSFAAEGPTPVTLRIARAADTPAVSPDQIIEWDMPQLRLRDAVAQFSSKTGVQITITALDLNASVGPIRGAFTPREVFSRMMEESCMDGRIYSNRTYRADAKTLPGLNDVVREYNLPRMYLPDAVHELSKASGGLLIAFLAYSEADDKTIVGPVVGRMTLLAALQVLLAEAPRYTYRWIDREMLSIEPPADGLAGDMLSRSALAQLCSVRIPPTSDRMLVSATRLPSLVLGSEPIIIDRRRIEEIGASTIPELLQYLPQSAFTRSSGYRPTGAQYAEGRGVGPAMVLIDRTRTTTSANSLSQAAFDLNTIPLSAVERIEFVADSGSVVYGVDSLGGMLNIVLRQPQPGLSAEGRYGSARDGAIERRSTAIASSSSGSRKATFIADHLELTDLLGDKRSRFADQDYQRYGGRDRRSLSGTPGNFRSPDNRDLPGFNAPIVGLPAAGWGESFDAADLSDQPNLTSLLRFQSVAPARTRTSLVGTGNAPLGDAVRLSGNALYTHQVTQFRLTPPAAQGVPIAATHPQNPLGTPLLYYGLLTGLPREYEGRTDLFRGSTTLNSKALNWNWDLSFVHSQETFEAQITSQVDLLQLSAALDTNDSARALDILGPAPGLGRTDLLDRGASERVSVQVSQAHLLGERSIIVPAVGDVSVRMGLDWRKEGIDFADLHDETARIASAGFLHLRVPVTPSLAIQAGIRRDHHSDSDSVTSSQYAISWRPNKLFTVSADVGERFRPPSIYELHLQPTAAPAPVLDPKTNQTTVVTLLSGGRADLDPTTARSGRIGLAFTGPEWEASIDYWEVDVKDRIDALPLLATLQYEDHLPGRVTRAPPHADNSPGQIQTIDLGWQNLGDLRAAGFDLGVRGEIAVAGGKLAPQVGLTWNTEYSFRDLPPEVSPSSDRVGIASARGTIPRYRLITTLTWENELWRVTANGRYHPKYRDSEAGAALPSHVAAEAIVDFNVARRLDSVILQLGATNLFNSLPDYSSVYAAGYDPSQGDLRGRTFYAEVKVGF